MKKIISLLVIAVMLMLALTSCSDNVRTKITKEEWDALDDITNYTLTSTGTDTELINNVYYPDDFSGTEKVIENAKYVYRKYDGDSKALEYYYLSDNGETYRLSKSDDETWLAKTKDWTSESLLEYITSGEVKFNDLIYNIKTKAYTCTYKDDDDMTVSYAYYFEDGALVKFDVRISDELGVWRETMTVSNIGTTKLDIPEYTIESED